MRACEVRMVLRMTSSQLVAYYADVTKRRGAAAQQELKQEVDAEWERQRKSGRSSG